MKHNENFTKNFSHFCSLLFLHTAPKHLTYALKDAQTVGWTRRFRKEYSTLRPRAADKLFLEGDVMRTACL
jgi:hypothetical protein